MEKDTMIAILLGILVLVSVVQAVELTNLKTGIEEGKITLGAKSAATTTSTTSSGGSGAVVPSNLQNLPDMVGGC
ncbi:MAG: hypothetical protein KAS12_02965 [Candidatus Aenigmarchaeota archaeon]|nr:hypothetical protein [Candidatus Aenigmarchaeota archaeon]